MKRVVMIMAAALAGITILAGARSLSPDSRMGHASLDPAFSQINEVIVPPQKVLTDQQSIFEPNKLL